LSLALWEVLVVPATAHDMRLRMADITRRMLVSKRKVTQLIDKLERAAWSLASRALRTGA
jgi:DNA-binding MarR family transcriptional regulator